MAMCIRGSWGCSGCSSASRAVLWNRTMAQNLKHSFFRETWKPEKPAGQPHFASGIICSNACRHCSASIMTLFYFYMSITLSSKDCFSKLWTKHLIPKAALRAAGGGGSVPTLWTQSEHQSHAAEVAKGKWQKEPTGIKAYGAWKNDLNKLFLW